MKRIAIALAALFLAGCGGGGDGGGPTAHLDYTLFSNAGNLPVGRRVVYLYGDWNGSTDLDEANVGDPRISGYTHEFEGMAQTEGQVAVKFTHSRTDSYWVTIYIDVDDSATLTAGDLVWRDFDAFACGTVSPGITESYTTTTDLIWETAPDDYLICWDYGAYTGPSQTY